MVTYLNKTYYLHFSEDPVRQEFHLANSKFITRNNEHVYLGMRLKTSNDITHQMNATYHTELLI